MKRSRLLGAHCGLPLMLLAVGLGITPAAFAQDVVWRCGPEGRSYSAQPCADGRTVAVADPRDEVQRAQAQEVAERERRLARQLGQERRQRLHAARASGQGAAGIEPVASEPPAVERAAHAPRQALRAHAARAKKATRKRSSRGRPAR